MADPQELICAVRRHGDSLGAIPMFDRGMKPIPLSQSDLQPGDVVHLKRNPDGAFHLVSRCATAGSARAQLYAIAKRFNLNPIYAPDVLDDARSRVASPGIDDPDLVDLTDLPFVTLDGASARDLDQALHIARSDDGYILRYALADAAHYVTPGSPLFEHGLSTGASFYMPGLTIPMLPRILSEDLISLNPEVVRRAFLFTMFLDANAHCTRTELTQARVRSAAKLTYKGVQALYDHPESSPLKDAPFRESLELLRELGLKRIDEQRSRDVVQIKRKYVEVSMASSEGLTFEAVSGSRINVERYNEQISLLCNIEGARILAQNHPHVQPVFRAHPSPTPARIAKLQHLIDDLVNARQLDPSIWRWRYDHDPREPLADYLDRLPREPATEAIRSAIERQAIVVNQRSIYQDEPGTHHGIGAPFYARFSSPMREIVGIYTHKEALEMLGRRPPQDNADDANLRERVIEAGNRSRNVQKRITKEANKLVLDHLFNLDLGDLDNAPARRATVMGLAPTRVYLQLHEPPIEVKLYVEDLERDHATTFALSESGVELVPDSTDSPTLRIGDSLDIRVRGYLSDARRWHFDVTCVNP